MSEERKGENHVRKVRKKENGRERDKKKKMRRGNHTVRENAGEKHEQRESKSST